MVVCPYCNAELSDENEEIDVEACPDRPFSLVLTRREVWGIIDNYHTKDDVIKKLKKMIGRTDL